MRLDELEVDDDLRKTVGDAGISGDVWAVVVGRATTKTGVLAVTADGISLFGLQRPFHLRWTELADLTVRDARVEIWGTDGLRFATCSFDSGEARDATLQTIDRVLKATGITLPRRRTDAASAQSPDAAAQARGTLTSILVSGFAVDILGPIVFDHGDSRLMVVGWFLAVVGGLATLFGVIGWGVIFGIRGSRDV